MNEECEKNNPKGKQSKLQVECGQRGRKIKVRKTSHGAGECQEVNDNKQREGPTAIISLFP